MMDTARVLKRQKVLIVDDTPANIEILHKILRDDYDIFFAKSGPDALRMVRRELPDLILLDVMMPGMDGYQVCTELKKEPQTARVPVVFVTAMGSDENEAKGLDCGAIDYLTKPISPPIVKARVRNHLELKRSHDLLAELGEELARKNRELEVLARADGLTGLANRRHFDEVLEAELKRATRSQQPLSLILCDVDHFKKYNDQYGHVAGDKCLQLLAGIMRYTFRRAGDLTARYGGEEFAAILPETGAESAALLAERLREELAAQRLPHLVDGVPRHVTISIGVVGVVANRERDAEWLIHEADLALYRSKQQGRDRVTVAAFE